MKISGIYKIQSKCRPERVYIGSAVNIKNRRSVHLNHLRNNKHHSTKLQRHYNKYGESDLIFSIIEPCFSQFLTIREQYYINRLKPYFNCCPLAGSNLGVKRSEEAKIRMSKAQRNRKPVSEEGRRNISLGHKGINIWMRGRHPSEQTREKISRANKGRVRSKESIEKFRKSRIDHIVSDETRKKISESKKGKILAPEHKAKIRNNNFGKHSGIRSVESRKRMSESRIAFYQTEKGVEIKQNLIRINTGKKASEETRKKMSQSHNNHILRNEGLRKIA